MPRIVVTAESDSAISVKIRRKLYSARSKFVNRGVILNKASKSQFVALLSIISTAPLLPERFHCAQASRAKPSAMTNEHGRFRLANGRKSSVRSVAEAVEVREEWDL